MSLCLTTLCMVIRAVLLNEFYLKVKYYDTLVVCSSLPCYDFFDSLLISSYLLFFSSYVLLFIDVLPMMFQMLSDSLTRFVRIIF